MHMHMPQASSWCRVEPANAQLTRYLAEWLNETWSAGGMGGAYNDDLLKLMGPAEYHVVSGGQLDGYPYRANATELVVPYQRAFAAMLERIRALTRKWIAANISARNMFMEAATRVYLRTLSFLLREEYLTSTTGLTGQSCTCTCMHVHAHAEGGVPHVHDRADRSVLWPHAHAHAHGMYLTSTTGLTGQSCTCTYAHAHATRPRPG